MNSIRILLAEDNPGDVLLIQESLGLHHIEHELHLVSDGEQALSFVADMGKTGSPPCPDVFLLDLNLPKVDGPTVLREFRKRAACSRTPVIVVTSSDRPKERDEISALGISHFFRKPSNFAEFMHLGAVVTAVVDASK